jgi:ring-1,2-phenylacetyl-CoA epoxidase subunit PaaD
VVAVTIEAPAITEDRIRAELALIADPEIPVLSLVELGVIGAVEVDGQAIRVALRPTFAGCPALHVMRAEIEARLGQLGATSVVVDLALDPPWSTDDLTPEARTKLRAFGLAPAPTPIVRLEDVLAAPRRCPRCDSTDTAVRNEFGPTPCRTIHYCRTCRQPFEGMKPV